MGVWWGFEYLGVEEDVDLGKEATWRDIIVGRGDFFCGLEISGGRVVGTNLLFFVSFLFLLAKQGNVGVTIMASILYLMRKIIE